MSATPAEPAPGALDPVHILDSLPQLEQNAFLAAYRQAVTAAVDPEGFRALLRILRRWSWHAMVSSQPDFQQAREAALAGTGGGMLLGDAVRHHREGG